MLVPLLLKGQIAVIRFGPVHVETIKLPIASVISCLRHSPANTSLFAIDGSGCVYSYDDELRHMTWQTLVSQRPHTGAYCGDGKMIGLHVSQFSGPSSVVVLKADTGERVADYYDRYCTGTPYMGDSVLLDSAWPGQQLHLSDGSIEEGLAAIFEVEPRRTIDPFQRQT